MKLKQINVHLGHELIRASFAGKIKRLVAFGLTI
jgi:hypothetical protein